MEVIINSHHAVYNMKCIIWDVKDLRLLLRQVQTFLSFFFFCFGFGVESLRDSSNEVLFINLQSRRLMLI